MNLLYTVLILGGKRNKKSTKSVHQKLQKTLFPMLIIWQIVILIM